MRKIVSICSLMFKICLIRRKTTVTCTIHEELKKIMRTIQSSEITAAVRKLAMSASCDLEPDILDNLLAARDREKSPLAKNALEILLTNKNTGTNVPAVIHFEMVSGDKVRIGFLPKGCGSENMSGLVMLPPSAGMAGVEEYVVQKVKDAGSNPCPPVVVGVGLGGTFEKAALLAKKALLRPLGDPNPNAVVAESEQKILQRLNKEGQGVMGWGGDNTALAVHIDTYPTHIASLPVAVNIQCHAHRHKELVL